jgi:hypothetical protein
MGAVKKTIIEFALVLSVGAALGFGFNPSRGSDRIKLGEDYFPDYTAVVEEARARASARPAKETAVPVPMDADTKGGAEEESQNGRADPVEAPRAQDREKTKHPDHPYHDMTFDEAADIYEDPNTELGVNVFIDARNDEAFAAMRSLPTRPVHRPRTRGGDAGGAGHHLLQRG